LDEEVVVALDLTDRGAIVTGASRGIGLATACALRDAGAKVVVTSRTAENADEAAAQGGDNICGFVAHASDETAASACVDWTMSTFGRVEILVNNAGTNPAHGPGIEQDYARYTKTMDVNLWATILWTRLVMERWMGAHGGSVINPVRSVASWSALIWACTT
jgi:NAD(P)-dependent dehydrogenase (short-subunit alcohol dehydrogenase family)